MTRQKRQVVVGKYSRPKKRARQFNFGVSKKIFYFLIPAIILGGIFYFLLIFDRPKAKEANLASLKTVNAEEKREAIGIWCKENDCFYFDKEGVIFEESPKSSGSLLILIEDTRDTAANLGSAVLSEPQIVLAEDLQRLLKGNFPFAVSSILIRADGEYELLTTEGWRILLHKTDSLEHQFSNLKYLLDEEIKERRRELDYVDLRLGNKIYYKYAGMST